VKFLLKKFSCRLKKLHLFEMSIEEFNEFQMNFFAAFSKKKTNKPEELESEILRSIKKLQQNINFFFSS
jgi:hypothetical protein